MKILFNVPCLESVYALRFIYEGYKNAFIDLGHECRPFTSCDNLADVLETYEPDIFFYSLHFYYLKYLDLELLKRYRDRGLVVFCHVRSWLPLAKEIGCGPLRDDSRNVWLIKNGLAGDVFWAWYGRGEPLMDGFEETTGYQWHSILEAADKTKYFLDRDDRFVSDLAYVGSYLPAKRKFFNRHFPALRKKYDFRIYGSDWTVANRLLGQIQRAGQYYNIGFLKGLRRLPLSMEDERKVYSSARISLNVHEEHVVQHGNEINERTYKILACGGFEITDGVRQIGKIFTEDELIIAKDPRDWFEKIDYYLKKPEEREKIAAAGRKKVLAEHTYHHRVAQVLEIYHQFKRNRPGSRGK